jgi:hypothetical protein
VHGQEGRGVRGRPRLPHMAPFLLGGNMRVGIYAKVSASNSGSLESFLFAASAAECFRST